MYLNELLIRLTLGAHLGIAAFGALTVVLFPSEGRSTLIPTAFGVGAALFALAAIATLLHTVAVILISGMHAWHGKVRGSLKQWAVLSGVAAVFVVGGILVVFDNQPHAPLPKRLAQGLFLAWFGIDAVLISLAIDVFGKDPSESLVGVSYNTNGKQ